MHHSICVSLRLDVECVTNLFQASRLLFIDIPVFFGRLVLVIQSILSCWMIAIHARNLRPLGSIFTQMNGSEQARMFKTPKPAPYKHYIIIYICVCVYLCVCLCMWVQMPIHNSIFHSPALFRLAIPEHVPQQKQVSLHHGGTTWHIMESIHRTLG